MRILFFLLFNFNIFSIAYAAPINFNLSSFIGRYKINNGADNSGNKVINLNPGNYTFGIKFGGTTNFTVNNDGTVTSADSTILTSSGSTLTLNTIPIFFDIGNYNNVYTISNSPYQTTSTTLYLPAKLAASIDVPGFNSIATITSDENGFVTVSAGNEKILGSKNKVFFNTVKVIVNPGPFNGVYAFFGGTFKTGITSHYLFPNTSYTIRTSTSYNIGNITTNNTHLNDSTSLYMKTIGDTVYLYTNQYTVTPPAGYTGSWQIYQQGTNTGVASKWLLLGMQSRMNVLSVTYNFIADSNCSSFNVSTAVGTFSFVCNNAASLIHNNLVNNDFNDIKNGYILNKTDGRLSSIIGDYSLSVNSASVSVSNSYLTNDTIQVFSALSEGRNDILLSGKDINNNQFQVSSIYWAGSSEVSVITTGPTDTVTLEVDQTIGSNNYNFVISKQAVNNLVVFKNVPRISNGNVEIRSNRGMKFFRNMLGMHEYIDL